MLSPVSLYRRLYPVIGDVLVGSTHNTFSDVVDRAVTVGVAGVAGASGTTICLLMVTVAEFGVLTVYPVPS